MLLGLRWEDFWPHDDPNNADQALLLLCTPTISPGPCPPTVAGPCAAWMPRKSLHGRTCGVSCDGERAGALQPSRRSAALHPTHPHRSITWSPREVEVDERRFAPPSPGGRREASRQDLKK
ncbi:hypothetical protein XarbCFBP7614_12295 [Xanthomonas arboricola]|nr:hypothetical protein XarbCFBP7614_12295 [Xanthomonas arboricola]